MNKKTITILYNKTLTVYKFRVNLMKEIKALGYEVVVISPYDEYVEKLQELDIKHHPIVMSQYGLNPLNTIVTTYEIFKIFKQYNPKFSLHYTIKPNIFGNIAANFIGIKVINNIAGAGKAFSDENSLFSKFIGQLYKLGLKSSYRVFFQNNDDMKLFIDKGLVKSSIAERIPGSGVDLEKYKASEPIKVSNSFLFVGRLLIEKGITYYLEAALEVIKSNPEVRFGIVGELEDSKDYIDKSELEKFLISDQITYHGVVSPDMMPKIIDTYSCVVLPSYYREGVPRSLLEAASFSKAIITTDSVGCREVVDDGINGYLCPIKDSLCLSLAMQKYIALDEKEKVQFGQNGRLKMEKEFDEKYVIDAYLSYIKDGEKM